MKFSRIKAESDGEYALTLYYMLPEETRQAYIQVGDEGDKLYYDFHIRDDYDRSKGLVMGIKTVYVQLKEGTNIVYYGCEDGQAPDLDKITVTPTKATQDFIDGIRQPEAMPLTAEQALRFEDGCIVCSTLQDGTLSIFDLNGRLLQRTPIQAGETKKRTDAHGPVILSLSTGSRAFARKVMLP